MPTAFHSVIVCDYDSFVVRAEVSRGAQGCVMGIRAIRGNTGPPATPLVNINFVHSTLVLKLPYKDSIHG